MRLFNIIKPTHACNLNCRYCFNEDDRKPIMNYATLTNVIDQSFKYCKEKSTTTDETGVVDFVWHGGEPMLVGLDFYDEVINLQQEFHRGVTYSNSIQTNGILINQKWIDFFRENNFNVSVSIDGPKELNDCTRVDKNSKGTFEQVLNNIHLLKKNGIAVGACAVFSKYTIGKEKALYNFFAAEQIPFEIIPLMYSGKATDNFATLGLQAHEYAEIWHKVFENWACAFSNEYIYCANFSYRIGSVICGKPLDCLGSKSCCQNNISTDPNGFIYPCVAFSSMPEWRYGNINNTELSELMKSNIFNKILNRKLEDNCINCKWHNICHGGCPARALTFFGTIDHSEYYCPSLFKIHEYATEFAQQNDGGSIPLS